MTVTFPTGVTPITLLPGQSQSPLPGAYGAVVVNSGATLSVRAGICRFTSLQVEPQGKLRLDQAGGAVFNDAAMQALGSYKGEKMLFLGLGTGPGSAIIVDDNVVPMELAHLPYQKATYEGYVGIRGLKKHREQRWRRHVVDVVARLTAAREPDDVVLGGGNVNS